MEKSQQLLVLIEGLKNGISQISHYLRDNTFVSAPTEGTNAFGEQQLRADLYADQVLFDSLQGKCCSALSEQNPLPRHMHGQNFIVTFDPLDGSSIIDTNFSVGTVVGIWDTQQLIGKTGRELVYSIIAVYGSRTVILLEEKEDLLSKSLDGTVSEFTLVQNDWVKTRGNLRISEQTKMFSPANLRASCGHPGYRDLVRYWQDQGYTLRYTGGMVPDIFQIFIKGSGVFANPATQGQPAKLRILYESAPIARLVEIAGGKTVWGQVSVLDTLINSYDQKIGMCVGSTVEVVRFSSYMSKIN